MQTFTSGWYQEFVQQFMALLELDECGIIIFQQNGGMAPIARAIMNMLKEFLEID